MFKVISLFTGIGGLDMGFGDEIIVHKDSIPAEYVRCIYKGDFVRLIKNPFEIIFQNDIDAFAKTICQINMIEHNYVVDSIYNLLTRKYTFPKSDVIIGGWPCKDFSHCGKRQGFNSLKTHDMKIDSATNDINRGTLYKCFVEVVSIVKPKIFVAENVYGLITMPHALQTVILNFENIGYDVGYVLVKCELHGIPQTRHRVIITGILKDGRIKHLDKDWYKLELPSILLPCRKLFTHLKEPNESIDTAQQLYSKAKKLSKGQGQKCINLDGPCCTIRAEHHGNIEFRRHECNDEQLPERRLTLRETALVQTFPPDFILTPKRNMKAYKSIGNAVPPLLSYYVALHTHKLLTTYF